MKLFFKRGIGINTYASKKDEICAITYTTSLAGRFSKNSIGCCEADAAIKSAKSGSPDTVNNKLLIKKY